jgi:type IV secretion system protein VirD4
VPEFEPVEDEPDDDAQRARAMQRQLRTITRQIALDPDDLMGL